MNDAPSNENFDNSNLGLLLTLTSLGSVLDKSHPIQQINVSSGWIVGESYHLLGAEADASTQVDGISVTYQLSDGSNFSSVHGSVFNNAGVVDFGCERVLQLTLSRKVTFNDSQRNPRRCIWKGGLPILLSPQHDQQHRIRYIRHNHGERQDCRGTMVYLSCEGLDAYVYALV